MTWFNSLKGFIGIGLLTTPAAYSKIGIVGGNLGMLFIGLIALYTMLLQVRCVAKLADPAIRSYSDLGSKVLGSKGKLLLDVCMMIAQLGFAIAYLIFIGSQLDQVVCFETELEFCDKKPMYILFAAVILTPICWLRDLKYLSYVSICTTIFLMVSRKCLYLTDLQC